MWQPLPLFPPSIQLPQNPQFGCGLCPNLLFLLNLEILLTGLSANILGQFRSKSDLKVVVITRATSLEFLGYSQRNVVALSRAEDVEADVHIHPDHYHQVLPHQRRLAADAGTIVSHIILGTNLILALIHTLLWTFLILKYDTRKPLHCIYEMWYYVLKYKYNLVIYIVLSIAQKQFVYEYKFCCCKSIKNN